MAPFARDPAEGEGVGLDAALSEVLKAATASASQRRHRFVTLEHLFRATLDDADAVELMVRCGADVADMKRELDEFLDLLEEVPPRAPLLHPRTLAVMRHLVHRVLFAGRQTIGVRDLLVALRGVKDDYAALLMHAAGIERLDLLRVISHGTKATRAVVEGTELARVRMYNDDYTTMEFVVHVLQRVFRLPEAEAHRRMMEIHVEGSALMGVMSVEQALERTEQVFELAEAAGHPLRVTIEAA